METCKAKACQKMKCTATRATARAKALAKARASAKVKATVPVKAKATAPFKGRATTLCKGKATARDKATVKDKGKATAKVRTTLRVWRAMMRILRSPPMAVVNTTKAKKEVTQKKVDTAKRARKVMAMKKAMEKRKGGWGKANTAVGKGIHKLCIDCGFNCHCPFVLYIAFGVVKMDRNRVTFQCT